MQALCNDLQLDFAHTYQPSAQLFPIDFQLQGLTAQSLAPSAQPCTTHPQQDINWTFEASAQPFPMSPQQVDPRFEENMLGEQHSMYMGCSPMLTAKEPMQSDPRGPPPKSKRPPLPAHPGALAQHNSLAVSRWPLTHPNSLISMSMYCVSGTLASYKRMHSVVRKLQPLNITETIMCLLACMGLPQAG